MKIKLLSVIVPVYKKEKTIKKEITELADYLESLNYNFEILPVVDGTELDKSLNSLEKIKDERIKPLGYIKNEGKGQAIRHGMKYAKGDVIAFIDSGKDLSYSGLGLALEHMKWYEADIIIGSKMHPASKVEYPLIRRFFMYGYLLGIKILFGFGIKIKDTQTGLKVFKKSVINKILDRMVVKRFCFDIEMLVVAHKLGFKKIYMSPVELDPEALKGSSVVMSSKFFSDNGIFKFITDTIAVWFRLNILGYYNDGKIRKKELNKNLGYQVNNGGMHSRRKQKMIDFVNYKIFREHKKDK